MISKLPKGWREYTVEQLIELDYLEPPIDGNHGSIHPTQNDYVPSGVPFIMAKDLGNGNKINYNDCRYIGEETARKLKKGFSISGDVLLTHKATMGRTAIVDDAYEYVVLTPQVTYYRVRESIYNKYLKYYFDSDVFQHTLRNWASSGSSRAYLGILAQRKLPIILPPLSQQKAIADTLFDLDAKIELNNKINENLEAQAQAIFKSWFVDFEPFQDGEFVESELGLIPEGWEVRALDDVADYINGLAMQRYRPKPNEGSLPVVKIRELRQQFTDSNSDRCSESIDATYIIDDGDVVFSWSGSLLVDIWTGGRAGLNQHLFKVTSETFPKWFYYLWTTFHLDQFQSIAKSRATTMGHIKRGHLTEAKVLVPRIDQLIKMTELMSGFINTMVLRRVENRTLVALRDTLLPKLISGEIEVPVD